MYVNNSRVTGRRMAYVAFSIEETGDTTMQLPDFDTAYPYGLGDSGITESQLREALGKDVVLMLGREDVDRDDPDLRKTPEADEQGRNRFARGLTMFERAKSAAAQLETDFNWRLVIVDEAAHVNAQMAVAAAELVE